MNYAKILYEILKIAINTNGVNYAGQGDIEEINRLTIKDYPIFWITTSQPMVEKGNTVEYHLTLNYIDKEKYQNDDVNDTNQPLIHSNGMVILGNTIRKVVEELQPLNEVYPISYNLWQDAEMFDDKCDGVWCDIILEFPKVTNCVID